MRFSSKAQSALSAIAFLSAAALGIIDPAVAQDRTELLSTDQSAMMTGYLYEGESVYAICDQDCSDINLYLYSEDGSTVYNEYGSAASKIATSAFPVVTAPHEGIYRIKAHMSACSASICSFAVYSDSGF